MLRAVRLLSAGFFNSANSAIGGEILVRQQAQFVKTLRSAFFWMLRGPSKKEYVEPLAQTHTDLNERLKLADIAV